MKALIFVQEIALAFLILYDLPFVFRFRSFLHSEFFSLRNIFRVALLFSCHGTLSKAFILGLLRFVSLARLAYIITMVFKCQHFFLLFFAKN